MHQINKLIGSHAIIAMLLSPAIGFAIAFFALHLHMLVAILAGFGFSWLLNFIMLLQFQAEMKRDIKLGL